MLIIKEKSPFSQKALELYVHLKGPYHNKLACHTQNLAILKYEMLPISRKFRGYESMIKNWSNFEIIKNVVANKIPYHFNYNVKFGNHFFPIFQSIEKTNVFLSHSAISNYVWINNLIYFQFSKASFMFQNNTLPIN